MIILQVYLRMDPRRYAARKCCVVAGRSVVGDHRTPSHYTTDSGISVVIWPLSRSATTERPATTQQIAPTVVDTRRVATSFGTGVPAETPI